MYNFISYLYIYDYTSMWISLKIKAVMRTENWGFLTYCNFQANITQQTWPPFSMIELFSATYTLHSAKPGQIWQAKPMYIDNKLLPVWGLLDITRPDSLCYHSALHLSTILVGSPTWLQTNFMRVHVHNLKQILPVMSFMQSILGL